MVTLTTLDPANTTQKAFCKTTFHGIKAKISATFASLLSPSSNTFSNTYYLSVFKSICRSGMNPKFNTFTPTLPSNSINVNRFYPKPPSAHFASLLLL